MQGIMDFLNGSATISLVEVIINLLLAAAMSQVIYVVFVKFGSTFSNRKQFGKIFFMITVSTTLIISVIQASLALSLGLVGALSIVRFRTAIKEPEELAYTFFCITMGLGFGANARGLSLVCGFLVMFIVIVKGLLSKKTLSSDTYNFSVVSQTLSLEKIIEILNTHTNSNILRRSDNEGSTVNAQFIVEFATAKKLEQATDELRKLDENVATSFISNTTFM